MLSLNWPPAFPVLYRDRPSVRRTLKFVVLWALIVPTPAFVAYLLAGLLGAWIVQTFGAVSLPFAKLFANVLHDYMIFDGPTALAHDLPDAAVVVVLAGGTLLAAALTLGRPIMNWITTASRFRWTPLLWGAALYGAVFAVGLAFQGALSPDGYRPYLGWTREGPLEVAAFLVALPLIVLVRAGAEELFFRGWLMECAASVTGWLPVAMLVSAVCFALLHREPGGERFAQLFFAGIAFAWVAMRTGGLELSIGLHTGWNLAIRLAADHVSVPIPADPALREQALLSLPQKSSLEWAILILLPLIAILLTEVIVRSPRLRRLVGLSSSEAAALRPSV